MLLRLSQLAAKHEGLPLREVGYGQAVATPAALGNLHHLFGDLLRGNHFALEKGRGRSGPQRVYELLRVANLFAQLPHASGRKYSLIRAEAARVCERLPKRVLKIEFAVCALGGLGRCAQHGDRLLPIKLGFLERPALDCLLARAVQVLDRFFGVRAAAVVTSELAQMIVDLLSE